MVGRLVKRALRRLILGVIRFPILTVAVVILLTAGGGYAVLQNGVSVPTFNLALPGPSRAPQSTDNYLKGNQTYNAELMWNSMSDEALERFRTRGGTQQDMQRQLEMARSSGTKVEQVNYIGGQGLPDGTSLQFYVVSTRGPGTRPDPEYVTYIFTLDRSGKITKIQ